MYTSVFSPFGSVLKRGVYLQDAFDAKDVQLCMRLLVLIEELQRAGRVLTPNAQIELEPLWVRCIVELVHKVNGEYAPLQGPIQQLRIEPCLVEGGAVVAQASATVMGPCVDSKAGVCRSERKVQWKQLDYGASKVPFHLELLIVRIFFVFNAQC